MCVSFFFFFSSRRRHTRLQGDWSSDVCSSDLAFLKVNLLVHRLLVRGYRSAAATCARAGLIPVRASGSKSSSRSNRSRFRPCRNSRPAWNFRSRISSGSSPSRSRNRFCRGTYASRVSRLAAPLGVAQERALLAAPGPRPPPSPGSVGPGAAGVRNHHLPPRQELDRKSTRLNSSHLVISYAVFCLKKKKNLNASSHTSSTSLQYQHRFMLS